MNSLKPDQRINYKCDHEERHGNQISLLVVFTIEREREGGGGSDQK